MATQIGEAVIKLSFDGKDVRASLAKVENEVTRTGKSTGSKWGSAWTVAAGNLIAKGVSKVASMVTNTMSGAISRLDTLNNFPKVMTALGYSAEEAEGSVKEISDALDGLPTSLDAAVGDVQKLAATMGNLDQGMVNATSVGLALNDMFLAGGKGTEAASAAMEQYNQMLANGRVDMQSWRSMVNAAPGQLDQLSKTLLGAEANQAALYKALQDGTVSFEQFNEAIVALDKEGGEGFSSFYDQAVAATGGVATQLENIGNTMNKIVAAALEGNLEDIDKYINQLSSRIGKVAPTLIKGFAGAFTALTQALPSIMVEVLPAVMEGLQMVFIGLVEALPMFADAIVQSIPIIMEGVMQLVQALLDAAPVILPQLITTVANGIIVLAQTLTQPQFLSLILQSAVTLFTGLLQALPQVLVSLVNALPSIIQNVVGFLLDPANLAAIVDGAVKLFSGIVMAVPQILGALLGAFGSLIGSLWQWITSTFGQFAANFGNFIGGIFRNAINGVLAFIENFVNMPIDVINGFIGAINDAFGFIGVNIGKLDRVSLPRLAEGGIADEATAAIIGEEGREAVLPLDKNTDNWAGLLASTLATEMQEQEVGGAGVTVYMTNQINNRLDAEDIGRVMIQSIRRAA